MFFDNYKDHSSAKINLGLFWEYDPDQFDFTEQAALVVERVMERGSCKDFYAMFNLYGTEKVLALTKDIPSMSQREMEFIKNVFGIPYEELAAYRKLMAAPGQFPNNNQKIRI
ncbi:MAG: hypothetical protein JST69_06775 [Bacteroidetes bacterium]|nr:hypothetical protein [Bacteroidota bacterium]